MTLNHLTLNTGNLVQVDRTALLDEDIDALRLPVREQDGNIQTLDGWFVDVLVPMDPETRKPHSGAAFFQIARDTGMSKTPAVMCLLVWREAMAHGAWQQGLEMYRALKPALRKSGLYRDPPPQMPPVPWLTVILTPFLAEADEADARKFGYAEQAISYALMDEFS